MTDLRIDVMDDGGREQTGFCEVCELRSITEGSWALKLRGVKGAPLPNGSEFGMRVGTLYFPRVLALNEPRGEFIAMKSTDGQTGAVHAWDGGEQ